RGERTGRNPIEMDTKTRNAKTRERKLWSSSCFRAFVVLCCVVAVWPGLRLTAVTRVSSADGQFWDIQDTSPWGQDSGGIATGGRPNPFNGFGYLKLQVRRPDSTWLVRNQYLTG